MATFSKGKENSKKGPITDTRKNLDYWHQSKLEYFTTIQEEELPMLKSELKKLYDSKSNDWNKIAKIKSRILQIEMREEETYYLLNIAPLMLEYYNLKKQSVENISNVLNKNAEEDDQEEKENCTRQLNAVINKYLELVDPNFVGQTRGYDRSSFVCPDCQVALLKCQEGRTCPSCAIVYPAYMDEESNTTFNDLEHTSFQPKFTYERINHFKEKLAQFQAKQHTHISDDILNVIREEMKKYRIKDPNDLSKDKLTHILKKRGLSKYNEHNAYIRSVLTNKEMKLTLTPEQERLLETRFIQLQEPWEKYRPQNRTNFLNYEYTFYKLFQLEELDEFMPLCKLPKSTTILREHDIIWKKFCQELNWSFISTI